MSDITRKYSRLTALFMTIHIVLNIGPLATYSIMALIKSDLTHEKITLCSTVFVVIIMTAFAAVNKIALRSRIWVILIGIYICLNDIITPLIVIASTQLADELLIHPLYTLFKRNKEINKQIDRRIPSDVR